MRWRNYRHKHKYQSPQVSILVPFRDDDEYRSRVWEWLEDFWESHLDYEVIIGTDDGTPFSKTTAVNDAARQASGQIFIILDADCFIDPEILQICISRINDAIEDGRKLWFVPYSRLYRLNREVTLDILDIYAEEEFDIPSPPPDEWVEPGNGAHYGHQYGALIMIMPAEAFWLVEGMDPRFRGWGGEDVSFMKSLDTLYALHETTDNDVFHLWHVRPGNDPSTRRWPGQQDKNPNSRLAQRYGLANGDRTFMTALVKEHREE